jgi:hypothetical protein
MSTTVTYEQLCKTTVAYEQLCNKEDLKPLVMVKPDQSVVMIVADGHNGCECIKIIENNATKLCNAATVGTPEAIAEATRLCSHSDSGAMLLCAKKYTTSAGSRLQVSSRGDCGCFVFDSDGVLIFEQELHSPATITPKNAERSGFPMVKLDRPAPPIPNVAGNFELHAGSPCIAFQFADRKLAAWSFVGHSGFPRGKMITSNIDLPSSGRIVLCSDGVTDVLHPSALSHGTAEDILDRAKCKWFGKQKIITFHDGSVSKRVGVYAPDASFADDMSIIVHEF